MTAAQIMEKMIVFSNGNIHDIDHFIRVWTYAKTIGESELLDKDTQFILEVAAITHDIARHQEEEGAELAKAFLSDAGITEAQAERVAWLVGHHHTLTGIDGTDWQILIEADYIANATEKHYDESDIRSFIRESMKTESGKRLAREVFCI